MGRWDEYRKTLSSAAADNPWSRKESKVSCKERLGSENGGDGRGGIEKWEKLTMGWEEAEKSEESRNGKRSRGGSEVDQTKGAARV